MDVVVIKMCVIFLIKLIIVYKGIEKGSGRRKGMSISIDMIISYRNKS